MGHATATVLAEGLYERMHEIELIAATSEGLRPAIIRALGATMR